jgi:two-component system, NarL family, sensor histidine kinase DesK
VVLPPDTERALALALREAATNVVRHARATVCKVTLEQAGGVIRFTIADNGVGGALSEGAGLSGMRARLAEVKGTVERDGKNGTRLTITVPALPAGDATARAAS